jgi:hypothetical protein
MLTTLFPFYAWTKQPQTWSKKTITRPDPPSPRLHRPHALHPILPHVQTPVPSLPPRILLLLHRIPLPLLPRLRQLLVSVRMDTNVLGGNLVMSSGLVAIFRLAVQESRDGIDHLVVLLSGYQFRSWRREGGLTQYSSTCSVGARLTICRTSPFVNPKSCSVSARDATPSSVWRDV